MFGYKKGLGFNTPKVWSGSKVRKASCPKVIWKVAFWPEKVTVGAQEVTLGVKAASSVLGRSGASKYFFVGPPSGGP